MGDQIPVTAKFSVEFYAKLRHRVVDELVDWFNQVDRDYRSEFRELFEVHFARFDAKLEQRIAELRAQLRAEFKTELSERLAALETRLIRWMFLFWVGTIGTMIALLRFWGG